MTHLIRCFVELETYDAGLAATKTVEFPELPLKWPEIQVIRELQDAVQMFKLGNTQFQKALKIFIVDGYVTEHVKIQQSVSRLYKQLTVLEDNMERIYAIYNRRLTLIEPLKRDLNPQAYGNYLQEFNVELVEIFAELYDYRREDIDKKRVQPTKALLA